MQDWEGWHPVFRGSPAAAREFASELKAVGLRFVVDDEPGPIVTRRGELAGLSTVLVPPEARERATEFARERETRNAREARSVTKRMAGVLGASLLIPTIWVLGHRVVPQIVPTLRPPGFVAIWLVSLVVAAQVEHRRRNRGASA